MKAVRFNRKYEMYQPGEVAGFPEKVARQLTISGVAEYLEQPKPKPEPKADEYRTAQIETSEEQTVEMKPMSRGRGRPRKKV